MNLLEKLQEHATPHANIALGVRAVDQFNLDKCLHAAEKVEELGYGKVILVGDMPRNLKYEKVFTNDPESKLVELLISRKVDAAVRGTTKAGRILELLKKQLKITEPLRIALLESSSGQCFLFAPVGIDEGSTTQERFNLTRAGVELLRLLGVEPKVAILSGGRLEDRGRSAVVDRSLTNGNTLSKQVEEVLECKAKHYGILIEDALNEDANFILAPDGISGNLMYRTLLHLGSGRSHGAKYAGTEYVFIDTSRAAPQEEYVNALTFASALTAIKRKLLKASISNKT
jgi:putative methanogen marker protein 4